MAVKDFTIAEQGNGYYIVKWSLSRGDTGRPLRVGMDNDISVQFDNVNYATDTILIQGTNWALTGIPNRESSKSVAAETSEVWMTLNDPQRQRFI